MAKKKAGAKKNRRKRRVVNQLVDSVVNPQIRGLHNQRRQVIRDANVENKKANNQFSRAKGDLNYIHGETTDYLNNLAAQGAQGAQDLRNTQDTAAAALRSRLGDTYSGATNSVVNELRQLGLNPGSLNMSGMASDAAFASSMGDQSSAMARSTGDISSANAASFLQGLQGMNKGSHTSNIGMHNNARNDALAAIADGRMAALAKIGDALTETRNSRGDLYTQLFSQLQQSGWKGLLGGGGKKKKK